ncbi:hypothetical protein HanLR1_Chr01g0001861 [Helianthus annuus]|nr:hypothetical protein HanHA89_Chr01g0002021 [Helianthus annuus]KAJ0781881.1 hypothetical protein HanLR1_Chr01g0001861 [Helianthus annuus]
MHIPALSSPSCTFRIGGGDSEPVVVFEFVHQERVEEELEIASMVKRAIDLWWYMKRET